MNATPTDPAGGPAARAELARTRIEELRSRREALDRGVASTLDSVQRAQQRARQALSRAEQAHHAAATRHLDAARVHRRAAAAHEQAALIGGRDGETHLDAAAYHRGEADRHEAAAAEDLRREHDDADRYAGRSGQDLHQQQGTVHRGLRGAERGTHHPNADRPATPVDRVDDDLSGGVGVDEGLTDEGLHLR